MENTKNEGNDNTVTLDTKLPNPWVLYLYDKSVFKKMANRPKFQAKPHKELCTLNTVNDLIYILQLMEVKNNTTMNMTDNNKINLDANDYIIMRKGIEPIWEDPKNSNGGTFTIKMDHANGYNVWSKFVMYMLGETMTYDMSDINGMTVSYISDSHNFNSNISNGKSYTYIKIWDAKPERTKDQFVNILPIDLFDQIKNESLMYTPNNKKKHYGNDGIINKLSRRNYNNQRGGFNNHRGYNGHNSNNGYNGYNRNKRY